MSRQEITVPEQNAMLKSYKRSSELLNRIYFMEKDFREHEIQEYSEKAHRAKKMLDEELENFMSFRVRNYLSPPRVKHRKFTANWRDPNMRSTRKRKRNENNYGNSS